MVCFGYPPIRPPRPPTCFRHFRLFCLVCCRCFHVSQSITHTPAKAGITASNGCYRSLRCHSCYCLSHAGRALKASLPVTAIKAFLPCHQGCRCGRLPWAFSCKHSQPNLQESPPSDPPPNKLLRVTLSYPPTCAHDATPPIRETRTGYPHNSPASAANQTFWEVTPSNPQPTTLLICALPPSTAALAPLPHPAALRVLDRRGRGSRKIQTVSDHKTAEVRVGWVGQPADAVRQFDGRTGLARRQIKTMQRIQLCLQDAAHGVDAAAGRG